MTKLHTVEQAAEILSVHPQTVRELMWAGELAWVDVRTNKRPRPRISQTEIERFAKARTIRAPKAA